MVGMTFGKRDKWWCRLGRHIPRQAANSSPEVQRWRCWCGARFWAKPTNGRIVVFRQPSARTPR